MDIDDDHLGLDRNLFTQQVRQAARDSTVPFLRGAFLGMLAELREDNQTLAARRREVHDVVDERRDIATASLIETWIDETEKRTWFLFESSRAGQPGH